MRTADATSVEIALKHAIGSADFILSMDLEEQQRIIHELDLRAGGLAARERVVERVTGAGFLVAASALAFSGDLAGVSMLAVAGAVLAFVVAGRVEFDMSGGFAVPTQLAFIPMLFVVPASLLPLTVGLAWLLTRLPDVIGGRVSPERLWVTVGNGWLSMGPALLLIVAGARDAGDAGPALLIAALLAQFAMDALLSALREALVHARSVREQLQELRPVAVTDAALTPVGLLIGMQAQTHAWAPFALVPLLGVLATFARERRERVRSLAELSNAYRGTALVLGDVVEADDGYTGEHSRGVVQLAMVVGIRLGLSAEQLRNLEFGALLHDVGKIAIPSEIINKPGKLDPYEWQIIRTHTIEGQALLDRVGGFMSDVGRIVRSHHERWDGGGYPDGLAGEAIPLEARIIAACDSWNAMTTCRSYRNALTPEAARAELIASSRTQLDPRIVDILLEVVSGDVPIAPPNSSAAAA